MGKIIRVLITIIVVSSFVLIARNQAAWAANPGADRSSSLQGVEGSVSPHQNKHCHDVKHTRLDCDDDDGGTVKPPRKRIKVCITGTYSVGGVATIQVKKLGRKDCITAFTEAYDSSSYPRLPSGKTALTDVVSLNLPKKGALVKLCFAAPPGANAGIYVIFRGKWEQVSTSGRKGTACTETTKSGTFILLR